MKPKKVFFDFVIFPIFFAGCVALSIYLTINLFLKFGWELCFAFIALLCIVTLVDMARGGDA